MLYLVVLDRPVSMDLLRRRRLLRGLRSLRLCRRLRCQSRMRVGRSCLGHHGVVLGHRLLVIYSLLANGLLAQLLLTQGALIDALLRHGLLAHGLLTHGLGAQRLLLAHRLNIHGLLWDMWWHRARNVAQGRIIRLRRHLSVVRRSGSRARYRQLGLLRSGAILYAVLDGRRVGSSVEL